jgi:hypothetical protein
VRIRMALTHAVERGPGRWRVAVMLTALVPAACALTVAERAEAVRELAGCYVARLSKTSRWVPGMFLPLDGPEVGLELQPLPDTSAWEPHAYTFALPGERYPGFVVHAFWVPTGDGRAVIQHYRTDTGFLMRVRRRQEGGLAGMYWFVGAYEQLDMPGRLVARRVSCEEAARANGASEQT